MITVFKYPLAVKPEQTIKIRGMMEILKVDSQADTPVLWAKVDTAGEEEDFHILTFGTGHDIGEAYSLYNYIGTYQLYEGIFVGHVFTNAEVKRV